MARTVAQIKSAVLREFGFDSAQDADLDEGVDQAFFEVVRKISHRPWNWNRVRGATTALSSGVGTVTLPARVALLDEQTIRIQKGSNTPQPIYWLNPVVFDRTVDDLTQQGFPDRVTSEEYTETRILRVWPVPDAGDYQLVYSFHRNLEYTNANVQLTDSDTVVAPELIEELIVAEMKFRVSRLIYPSNDPRIAALFLYVEDMTAKASKALPVVDPQVAVEAPIHATRFFRQGI